MSQQQTSDYSISDKQYLRYSTITVGVDSNSTSMRKQSDDSTFYRKKKNEPTTGSLEQNSSVPYFGKSE